MRSQLANSSRILKAYVKASSRDCLYTYGMEQNYEELRGLSSGTQLDYLI